MTISAALANAASGLAAISRSTEVISSNVANATTPGYGRRAVNLTNLSGGGVQVASIDRMVSAFVLADHRNASAGLARADTLSAHYGAMEDALGIGREGEALTEKLSAFEAALLGATSRPDSPLHLEAATDALKQFVGSINRAAEAVADARSSADSAIARDVETLNRALADIAQLNRSIIVEQANNRDAASLIDERQRTIDSIAPIVALRETQRDNGRIALFTEGGAVLLDGDTPVNLSFAPAGRLAPEMQVGTPPVSRLMIDGEELSPLLMTQFGGGRLEANFEIRDEAAPLLQQRLDSLAFELGDRFSDAALDPSLGPGMPGLFTDAGAMVDPNNQLGLANRLAVNTALLQPNAAWRLRDGLGAATPGLEGDATLLTALSQRLADTRSQTLSGFPPGSRNVAGLIAELGARASTDRVAAQITSARENARKTSLLDTLLSEGVDTDAEMQRLLELEQAYAANARVIAAADAMIGRLLEI